VARPSNRRTRGGVTGHPAPRLSYVLGRAEFALRRRLGEALSPLGLTLPQYTALSVLRRRDGLSNAQLARRALITPQSMITITTGLERKGLITRVPDPAHGRILRTLLTSAGDRLLVAADAAVDAIEADMLQELSSADRGRLLDDLKSCVRMLGAGFVDI
jgi:DNA-binding MarR family transcriptional regulator